MYGIGLTSVSSMLDESCRPRCRSGTRPGSGGDQHRPADRRRGRFRDLRNPAGPVSRGRRAFTSATTTTLAAEAAIFVAAAVAPLVIPPGNARRAVSQSQPVAITRRHRRVDGETHSAAPFPRRHRRQASDLATRSPPSRSKRQLPRAEASARTTRGRRRRPARQAEPAASSRPNPPLDRSATGPHVVCPFPLPTRLTEGFRYRWNPLSQQVNGGFTLDDISLRSSEAAQKRCDPRPKPGCASLSVPARAHWSSVTRFMMSYVA